MRHYDEFGKRLFWYMDASDAMLERLYVPCAVPFAPSEGEGFGLPLIATCFRGWTAPLPRGYSQLAGSVSMPAVGGDRWLTWAGSAAQLSDIVLGKRADMNDATSNHWNGLA